MCNAIAITSTVGEFPESDNGSANYSISLNRIRSGPICRVTEFGESYGAAVSICGHAFNPIPQGRLLIEGDRRPRLRRRVKRRGAPVSLCGLPFNPIPQGRLLIEGDRQPRLRSRVKRRGAAVSLCGLPFNPIPQGRLLIDW